MNEMAQGVKEIRETLPAEIRTLIGQANFDLYCGPCSDEDFPGFTTACRLIRDALAEVSLETDEGTEVDRATLIRALVGRELAPYVR